MNIMLTGATGFIGDHILQGLNSNSSYITTATTRNKCALAATKIVEVGDINAGTIYESALSNQHVVIHAAAIAHVLDGNIVDPLSEYRKVNVEGTINLARQAEKFGVKRFIYLSSIKVHGESTSNRQPFSFSDKCIPEDGYGQSKAEAEEKLLALSKVVNMEIVVIRSPLVYGEGVKANFASLMKLVGKGIPLPFRSIKRNKRSLVSVYNLVDLIKVCIDHPKAANQVFLVSDDDDMSTARMVALMAKVQGKTNMSLPVPAWCFKLMGKLLKKEAVVDRLVGSLQLDIEHTKKTLGWIPPYSVEYGFKLAAKTKDSKLD